MRTCPRRVTPLLVMLKVLPLALPALAAEGTGEGTARESATRAWAPTRDGAARAAAYGTEQSAQAWHATRSISGCLWNPVTRAFDGDGR